MSQVVHNIFVNYNNRYGDNPRDGDENNHNFNDSRNDSEPNKKGFLIPPLKYPVLKTRRLMM